MGIGKQFVKACAFGLAFVMFIPAAAAQNRQSTAVIAVGGDPGHLNPAISTAGPLHTVAGSIYNGLVRLDEAGQPQPDLAESWSIAPDGTVVTFRLRAGVRWHDGTPFSSADVKFSFEEVLFRFHARARSGLAPAVATIETPDDQTVIFRLKRSHPALMRQLDQTEAPILPRHIYVGSDPNTNPANARPVGTGPFKFESYRRDDQVILVRNQDYFKQGLPILDRLVFRIIPDPNTQINALLRSEVDVLTRISAADVERVKGKGVTLYNTKTGPGGANCIMTLSYNLERPRMNLLKVRQAFAASIDRAQILDRIAFGQGRVASAPISSGIAWAHAGGLLDGIKVDHAAAGALLDNAGLRKGPDGVRATFDLLLFPAFNRYGELLRQQLAQVGVSLRLRQLDPAAFAQTVFTQRDFDIALVSYCNGVDPEIGVRRMYDSANIGAIPFSNAAAYRNADVDRLLNEAGSETSENLRGRAYREMQKILARDLPYWWLIETDFTAAWRDDFKDFEPWSGQVAEKARRAR